MHAVIANPAYWAFCWGSGLAMARWILDHPEVVRDQVIVDLGSGSGVVAIAAALAGAKEVWACDNDVDALAASLANASLNGVTLKSAADVDDTPMNADLLCMADVLYDRSNFALIDLALSRTKQMVIADSRIADVEHAAFQLSHRQTALTYPNLGEFEEFRTVSFFVTARPQGPDGQ